jgi:hypothetical protein
MGEIKDIAFSLPETMKRLDEMIEHSRFLKSIDQQYIKTNPEDFTETQLRQGGYVKMDGERYGALNGQWVRKEIADDIKETARQMYGADSDFLNNMEEYFKWFKSIHTIYNTKTHLNNLLSSVTMQYMAGANPAKAAKNATRGAMAIRKARVLKEARAKQRIGQVTPEDIDTIKKLSADDDVSLWLDAENNGLFGRSNLNAIMNQYLNISTKSEGGLRKIHDAAGELYQSEDNVMRFALLRHYMDKGQDLKTAIKSVNANIPDYSKPMSKAANVARRYGIAPFISWTYYSLPMMYKQLGKRPARAAAVPALFYGLYQSFDINPFTEEDIPQSGYAWRRVPIYQDGNEITTLKVDRWLPHIEALNPEKMLHDTLWGGNPWINAGGNILANYNPYFNNKVTYQDGIEGAYQRGKSFASSFLTPDILDQTLSVGESVLLDEKTRSRNAVTQPRTTIQELLNLAGFNTLTYDKQNQKEKAIRERLD